MKPARSQSGHAAPDGGGARPFRPWAIIPAKRFGRAKSRLGAVLRVEQRRHLAAAMFEGVLDACVNCRELDGTLIATDGDDVAALATQRGAAVLRDSSAGLPLAAVIDRALESLVARGATHALVVMADLPWLRSRDLDELLAQLRSAEVVVSPDLSRRGTSALGLQLDLGLRSCFGHSDSLQRHLQEAARIGASCAVVHNPRVAFDVDIASDLAQVCRLMPPPGVSCSYPPHVCA